MATSPPHDTPGETEPGLRGGRVVVLGVGNLLLSDEGLGPTFVAWFRGRWELPDNVEAVDGATAGLDLLSVFDRADFLVVVDTVLGGGEPGTVYRFRPDQVPAGVRFLSSMHQMGFIDAWNMARLLGPAPEAVVIGVEPEDMSTPHVGLTETLAARLPVIEELVLQELRKHGVRLERR